MSRGLVRLDGDLTERQQLFIRQVAQGESVGSAALRAGFADDSHGHNLLTYPHVIAALHREVQRVIQKEAGVSIKVLRELRDSPGTPAKVRHDCATFLARTAGHVAPTTREESADKQLSDMTREELAKHIERNQVEIDRIEGELAARAKDVSAHVGAQNATIPEPKSLDFLD